MICSLFHNDHTESDCWPNSNQGKEDILKPYFFGLLSILKRKIQKKKTLRNNSTIFSLVTIFPSYNRNCFSKRIAVFVWVGSNPKGAALKLTRSYLHLTHLKKKLNIDPTIKGNRNYWKDEMAQKVLVLSMTPWAHEPQAWTVRPG